MTKILRGPLLTRYHASASEDGRYLELADNLGQKLARIAKGELALFVAWMEKEGLVPREGCHEYGGAIRAIASLSEENAILRERNRILEARCISE